MFEVHDFAADYLSGDLVAGDDALDARWVTADTIPTLPMTQGRSFPVVVEELGRHVSVGVSVGLGVVLCVQKSHGFEFGAIRLELKIEHVADFFFADAAFDRHLGVEPGAVDASIHHSRDRHDLLHERPANRLVPQGGDDLRKAAHQNAMSVKNIFGVKTRLWNPPSILSVRAGCSTGLPIELQLAGVASAQSISESSLPSRQTNGPRQQTTSLSRSDRPTASANSLGYSSPIVQ